VAVADFGEPSRTEEFRISRMPNGLTLVGEPMEQVSSAAMTLLVPAGASHDPVGREGSAMIASEWCLRGAGDRDTRQLHEALDGLGCQHHEYVSSEHIQFGAAALGRNLPTVLKIYADILRRPRLADATFEPCRALARQDLAALEDEPAQKCDLMLRERFYPWPLGRCECGTAESLADMTGAAVRQAVAEGFAPAATILAVAGKFDWQAICDTVDRCLGDWRGPAPRSVRNGAAPGGAVHVQKPTAQVHIGLAHPAVTKSDPQYYAARVAETILSVGMGSRLFTEVREKRGLVYHVSCHYHSLKDHAGMFTYAAAIPAKGQTTLEVTVGEIRRLADGVEEEEMARAKVQLKSALVMQGESTSARATALASDWYHLGRLRSLSEVSGAIDAVTRDDVLTYARAYRPAKFTVLVIGPEALDTSALAR
jgi:predicted Zn-dependent peptidase